MTEKPDRRSESRVRIAHKFSVYHRHIGHQICSTRDLSLNGVFVVGDFTSVSLGENVKISFVVSSSSSSSSQNPGDGKKYELSAVVMRLTHEGAGLRFISPDMDTSAALIKLMYG